MPRRRWTSKDQLDWLQPWVTAFTEAQGRKEYNPFFAEVYKEWFQKYPLDKLKAQEVGEKIKGLDEAEATGNMEKAEKIRETWWQQRLHNWFNNNTRAGSSADDKRGILKVTKPRQGAEWQTYLTMYYDKLKPEIEQAYETYTASLEPNETPKKRVNFQAEFTQEKYSKEKEDVQKKVEEFRKDWREKQSAGYKSKDPNELQAGISCLPRTIRAYAQGLAEQTGWSFTILAGGPNPRHGGKITTYSCHVGSVPGSNDEFDSFLGKEEWGNSIIAKWDTFLHNVYPEDIREQFACSHEGTPAPTEGTPAPMEETSAPMEETSAPSDKDNAKGQGEEKDGEKKKKRKEKSQYLIDREKSIERNRELLAPFFEALEGLKEDEQATKKRKKEGKKTTKAKAITIKDKPITRSQKSVTPSVTPSNTHAKSGIQTTQPDAQMVIDVDGKDLSDATLMESDIETREEAVSKSTITTIGLTTHDAATIDKAIPENAGADSSEGKDGKDVEMKDLPATNTIGASNVGPTPNAVSIDIAVPDNAGANSSAGKDGNDVEMNDSTANETHSKSGEDLPIANQDLEVELFLRGITDQHMWQDLISKWLAFESDYPIKGNLSTTGRPEEVAWWLKRGRKYKVIPPIKKRNEYVMAWMSWWKGMQPDGRKSDPQAWPFPRMDFTTADWLPVARAGPTGLLLVVVSLAWWGHHVQGEGQMEEFLLAVDDVLWVLTQITSLTPPQSLPAPESVGSKSTRNMKPKPKRDLDLEAEEPKNKKQRVQ